MPMRSILGSRQQATTTPWTGHPRDFQGQRQALRQRYFGNREITDSMMADQRYTDYTAELRAINDSEQRLRDSGMGLILAVTERNQRERQMVEAAQAEQREAESALAQQRAEIEAANERRAQLGRRRQRAALQSSPSLFSQLGG